MRKFIVTGDIMHAGSVVVLAESKDEAVKKAEAGEFEEVWDETDKDLGFHFDGSLHDHVRELPAK